MTHFGSHVQGSNRSSGSLGSYGLSTSHSAVQPFQRSVPSDGAAGSRSIPFRTPHYIGVANIREPIQRDRASSQTRVHPSLNDYGNRFSSMYVRQKMGYNQDHKDRPSSRIHDYRFISDYGRPHSSLGHFSQSGRTCGIASSSHATKKSSGNESWRLNYKSGTFGDHPTLYSDSGRFSSGSSFRSSRPSDAALSYYKHSGSFQRIAKDTVKFHEPTGWRAKLCKEGYHLSPRGLCEIKAPTPEPYEIADDDESAVPEGFIVYMCRGTSCDDEENEDSVYRISRQRRIKVPVRDSSAYTSSSVAIQVETEELEALNIPKRSRGVTRHRSWYQDGSYNRYVSPMPWRSSMYCKDSWRRSSRNDETECCATDPKENTGNSEATGNNDAGSNLTINKKCPSQDEVDRACDSVIQDDLDSSSEKNEINKDFRKSVLNVDLPENEAAQFAKMQEQTRRRDLKHRRRKHLSLTSTVSADGSPSETGYDSPSSYTDAEESVSPSSHVQSGKINDLDGSSSPSERLSCIDDHILNTDEEFNCMHGPLPSSVPYPLLEMQPEDFPICSDKECSCKESKIFGPTADNGIDELKFEPAFRFQSINNEPSQRDSGFSELINRSDSPLDNALRENGFIGPWDELPEGLRCGPPFGISSDKEEIKTTDNLSDSQQSFDTSHKRKKFICEFRDIDSVLFCDMFEQDKSFEDFERQFDRCKEDVRNISTDSSTDACSQFRPSRSGLRLDLNQNRFIGDFRDIDEVLGKPSPLSPESDTLFGIDTNHAPQRLSSVESSQSDREDDGGSTTATSVLEAVDVDDVAWLGDFQELPNDKYHTMISRQDSGYPEYDHIPRGSIKHPAPDQLDDCTLQLYRYNGSEGDYGSYLDLESTIDEQTEEFEGFHENRKNAVILRTQLSVRVHAIIEKLVNSTGRELRRALFSLKQIFQDDKDLVHEFVQNDGLACLIKVGSEADQNYQNYILRALGQVMLYVDGMNGVIEHNETIQWLYSLISSKYRLVVKTALKLLLVFIEYTESNSQLLMNAVCVVDSEKGSLPWSNIMNLLKEKDSADMELLVYAVTLINKTLNGIPDQDTYYDVVDNLEEQGMEHVIQYYMSKQGTDLDLLQQFQIYETVLKHEDGVPDNKSLPLDSRFRQVPRSRKSYPDDNDRRKSRRYSAGTMLPTKQNKCLGRIALDKTSEESPFSWQNRNQNHVEDLNQKNSNQQNSLQMNGNVDYETSDVNGITPALRRRRERDARNKSLIKEQEENGREAIYQRMDSVSSTSSVYSDNSENSPLVKESKPFNSIVERHRSRFENHVENENRKNQELSKMKEDHIQPEDNKNFLKQGAQPENNRPSSLQFTRGDTNKKAWMFSMMYAKSQDDENKCVSLEQLKNCTSPVEIVNNNYIVFNKSRDEDTVKSNLRRDSSVKDMQEKFINKQICDTNLRSPTSENLNRLGDTSGIISRAKEGLAASTTRPELKTQTTVTTCTSPMLEPKKPESDLQWEQLTKSIRRPLVINDLDFTDLKNEDDFDCLGVDTSSSAQDHNQCNGRPSPPPLPPGTGPPPPPPPLPLGGGPVPPPPPPQSVNSHSSHFMSSKVSTTQAPPPPWVRRNQHHTQDPHIETSKTLQKTKKTVKLFWKEVKEDRSLLGRIGRKKTIWDELKPVHLDTQKLEHLFENRAKDVINKEKTQEGNKKNEIIVLDTKRSNAINIGMTKLPPPRTIKTAILKMDSTIMNREGIEKILTTMLPTEDEKARIAEAQMSNPDVPLGTAEQFLLTLSSISELEARLRLWAFRLDYDTMEREVAEPLMDLKQAMREIENSDTFRVILSTLRSVGNFLNGIEIKGFHIEYLSKVPEVKDTVHKHSLLHHLCHIVMEKFPQSSDLYSEIGAVTRASKIDYAEVAKNLSRMESECKASWDYLKAIAKHDGSITMKVRTSEFLTDCAERIIVLGVIHRRMINRYHKFLVYLGCSILSIEEMPIQKVCKVLSEFALEYRTTRERVLQQMEKKANHRERNKTRGKMITDMDKFRTKEQQADHELRQLLGNGNVNSDDQRLQKWGTVPGVRGRVKSVPGQGGSLGRHSAPAKEDNLTDADDEILETLVKTATTQSARNEPKIRKKARYGDRKSLRRTLKSGLSEEERNMLSTMTT